MKPAEPPRNSRLALYLAASAVAGLVIVIILLIIQRFGDNRSATKADRNSDETFDRKPPPPGGDRQPGFAAKPPMGAGRRRPPPPSPLVPLADIENPIADGPVEQMWTQAQEYAKSHPKNYRDILVRHQQVRTKAAGTALEKEVEKAMTAWKSQKDGAVKKEIKSFTQQMEQSAQLGHGPHSVAVWRDFPDQLRSAEVDEQIHQIIYDFVLRIGPGQRPGFGPAGPPPDGPPPKGEPPPRE